MPHQVPLTLAASVRAGEAEPLRRLLETMGDGVANNSVIDFDALEGVHFARFVLSTKRPTSPASRCPRRSST